MPFDIVPLSSQHNLKDFDCGEGSMNRYLRDFALVNHKRGLNKAYVAIVPGKFDVKGYYTLSNGQVSFDDLPVKKKGWPKYPIPITLLGRLAADRNVDKAERLGETLLLSALRRSGQTSESIGSYAVVVDALNDSVKGFYKKYGFIDLDGGKRLFLPMATIAELGL